MSGPYDNESQVYLASECLAHGHWYLDEDGMLYIVPNPQYGLAEIEGPDDEICSLLGKVYQAKEFAEVDPEEVAKMHDLEYVSPVLHRFTEQTGYYSA